MINSQLNIKRHTRKWKANNIHQNNNQTQHTILTWAREEQERNYSLKGLLTNRERKIKDRCKAKTWARCILMRCRVQLQGVSVTLGTWRTKEGKGLNPDMKLLQKEKLKRRGGRDFSSLKQIQWQPFSKIVNLQNLCGEEVGRSMWMLKSQLILSSLFLQNLQRWTSKNNMNYIRSINKIKTITTSRNVNSLKSLRLKKLLLNKDIKKMRLIK